MTEEEETARKPSAAAMTSGQRAELTRRHDAAIDALWESADDMCRDSYIDARNLWFALLAEVDRLERRLEEKAADA